MPPSIFLKGIEMTLRPLSQSEQLENTLSKPHKFIDGKYVLDTGFEPTEFPKYKYRCLKGYKIVKKGDKRVKVAFPKEEAIIVKSAAAEAKLEKGQWYDRPRQALMAYRKVAKKSAV
jgi:hypothetical protein